MSYARIVPEVHFSFNDHPFRKPSLVIYFCGCPRRCKGCHSPELQDRNSDLCITVSEEEFVNVLQYYLDKYKNKINSLVLLGGEPLLYTDFLIDTLKILRRNNGNLEVILYTGYIFEEIPEKIKELINFVIDGEYKENLKTNKFPASYNQRVFYKENKDWFDITTKFLK